MDKTTHFNSEKIHSFFKELDVPQSAKRREDLLLEMARLGSEGKNCLSCEGFCCTYHHNSMKIDIVEALDLYLYLLEDSRWTSELMLRLKNCIKEFRLDKEISLKGNSTFRRYYTCPFFEPKKGCLISRKSKPFGCLAFNPHKLNVAKEGMCGSNQTLLNKREENFKISEQYAREVLREKLNLWWEKQSIPVALLEVDKALNQI